MPTNEPDRPSPDELLLRVSEADRRQRQGKLKIFFGAAPGVGKTYAMLEAARAQSRAGREVLVGIVETHQRQETETLVAGFEVLPRRPAARGGGGQGEFDLDAALARHPDLLLVDELAHSNAPGSRHSKRWQDVMELVEAGVSVYSTLNVQHLDSLNDVVARVTGVAVRETVPDSVLDRADEIELIDLSVDDLLRRVSEGKVYVPDQAQRALSNFFRPGNLIALREMALRRTADRVDAQMRIYRRDHSIASTWPVAERLIVSIGPSPFSAKLIRAAKRMADRLQAEWIVAFVETPAFSSAPEDARDRVLSSLRLGEQLGAESVRLVGENVAVSLLQYARSRNVSKIVVGKQHGPLWRRLLSGSVLDELFDSSGDIDIYAISGEPGPPLRLTPAVPKAAEPPRQYWFAAAVLAACTVLCLALRSTLNPVNLVMFYLLGVVAIAMRSSRAVALAASVLSVAAFDFFCVPPFYTFAVADYEFGVTFLVMLFVAVTLSTLTIRVRGQAAHAVEREGQTQALYRLTRELAGDQRGFDAARAAAAIASDVFGWPVVIFLPSPAEHGQPPSLSFRRRTSDHLPVPQAEEEVARWVYSHGQRAGRGTDTLAGATALYLPLRGSQDNVGVMAIGLPDAVTVSPEQIHLLELFATQIALALDRRQMADETHAARVRAETEQLRNSLLSAVSHDLRTPLASITGSATTLLEQGERLASGTRHDLLSGIAEEAQRLSRLVNNLLDMTRLEAGTFQIKRDWHSLEEIAGAALRQLDNSLRHHPVHVELPPDLPLIRGDDVLIEQLLANLLENAAKHTPPGTDITLSAQARQGKMIVEVSDRGPGFPPGDEKRIWEKFYRGPASGSRGVGLGLAICRAIVTAHGGTVVALNRPEGGATIRIQLPLDPAPLVVTRDD